MQERKETSKKYSKEFFEQNAQAKEIRDLCYEVLLLFSKLTETIEDEIEEISYLKELSVLIKKLEKLGVFAYTNTYISVKNVDVNNFQRVKNNLRTRINHFREPEALFVAKCIAGQLVASFIYDGSFLNDKEVINHISVIGDMSNEEVLALNVGEAFKMHSIRQNTASYVRRLFDFY